MTGFISGFLSTVVVVAFFALLPMVSILKCFKTIYNIAFVNSER